MVSSLNIKAHLFQCQNNVATAVFAGIGRFHVKVVFVIVYFSRWVALFVSLEQKEFWFRTDVE